MRPTEAMTIPLRTGVEVWADAAGDVSVAFGQIVRRTSRFRYEPGGGTEDAQLLAGLTELNLLAEPACRDCRRPHELWAELGSAARQVSAHKRSLIARAPSVRTNSRLLAPELQAQLSDFVGAEVPVGTGFEEMSPGDVLFLDIDADLPFSALPEAAIVVIFRAVEGAIVCAAPTALRAAPCVDCVIAGVRGATAAGGVSTRGDGIPWAPLVAAAIVTTLQQLELGTVANGSAMRWDTVTGLFEQQVLRTRSDCGRCRSGYDAESHLPALAYEEMIASPFGFDVEGLLSPPPRGGDDAPPRSPQRPRVRVVEGALEVSAVYPSDARPPAVESLVAIAGDLFGRSEGVHREVPSAGGLQATRCYVVSIVGGTCHTFELEAEEERTSLALVRTAFALDAADGIALVAVCDIDALVPKYRGNAPRLAALELGMCIALMQHAIGAAHASGRFDALHEWEAMVPVLPRRRLSAGVHVPSSPGSAG